jgi:hypothetical protein
MAAAPSHRLYLRLDPAQRGVRERLLRLGADLDPACHEAALPLGEARPEEILAECRQLGIRVLASVVRGDGMPG